MTLLEFEAWISDNYESLKSDARRIVRKRRDATELLHEAIEGMLSRGTYEHIQSSPGGLLASRMQFDLWNSFVTTHRGDVLKDKFAASMAVLGADTYAALAPQIHKCRAKIDWSTATAEQLARVFKVKTAIVAKVLEAKKGGMAAFQLTTLIEGGPGGNARWRYQQLRDEEAFHARALESRAESLGGVFRRTSSPAGVGSSFVHFGREELFEECGPDGNERPWTMISSQTGTHNATGFHVAYVPDAPSRLETCSGCLEHAITGRHDKACAYGGR